MTTQVPLELLKTPPSGKNYIINPTFSINQRGYDGTGTSTGYKFDRWIGNTGTTISLPDANGFITIGGGTYFRHLVEAMGVEGIMTLSWDGTATADVQGDASGDLTDNTSPYTFNSAGIWDKGTDADALNIRFLDGTLRNVKLEIGSVATPVEYPDTGTELAKCQRYFQISDAFNLCVLARYGVSTGTAYNHYVYPVKMRTTPTFSSTAGVAWVDQAGYSGTLLANALTSTHVTLKSTNTVIAHGILYASNGKISLDAEL